MCRLSGTRQHWRHISEQTQQMSAEKRPCWSLCPISERCGGEHVDTKEWQNKRTNKVSCANNITPNDTTISTTSSVTFIIYEALRSCTDPLSGVSMPVVTADPAYMRPSIKSWTSSLVKQQCPISSVPSLFTSPHCTGRKAAPTSDLGRWAAAANATLQEPATGM